ncbi:MAG: hypothetical protein ACE145_17820 [Terriglobia bacterium]
MATHLTVEEIIEAVKRLKPEERVRLLHDLARNPAEPQHEITELRGLGKEVWDGIDAQEYINAERDSWDK